MTRFFVCGFCFSFLCNIEWRFSNFPIGRDVNLINNIDIGVACHVVSGIH